MPTRFWRDAQRARYGPIRIHASRGCRPWTPPTSASPIFRIGLSQSLMSVHRSSRTHGPRSGCARRTRLPAVRPVRRAAPVPPHQPPLRAHVVDLHDQPRVRRAAAGLYRPQDDDGVARPPHTSLRHRGDRQRLLALQTPRGGVRISRRSWVKSRRRLTRRSPPTCMSPGKVHMRTARA